MTLDGLSTSNLALYIIQHMSTSNTKKKKLVTNVAKVGVIITSPDVLNKIAAPEVVFMVVSAHRMETDVYVQRDGTGIDVNRISTNAA